MKKIIHVQKIIYKVLDFFLNIKCIVNFKLQTKITVYLKTSDQNTAFFFFSGIKSRSVNLAYRLRLDLQIYLTSITHEL